MARLRPGVFSGTLGNVGAAMSYGRSFLPTLRGDLVKTFDRALSPIRRIEAALFLAFKVAVIAVIAYAVKQEWQIHIVNAPITAAAQASKASNEARTIQQQTDVDTRIVTPEQRAALTCGDAELRRQFGAKYGCPVN